MDTTIEDLQRQLQEQIEALAKQRTEESARYEQELADRNAAADAERAEQVRKHQEAEEIHRKRREKELEEVDRQRKDAIRLQAEAERNSKAAADAEQQRKEKLDWLEKEIANQEHIEEQHRKHIEDLKATHINASVEPQEINVEHPAAPVSKNNPGDAVEGTDADAVSPTMSQHLKHILRQAQRQ